jgi:hypothetical protein
MTDCGQQWETAIAVPMGASRRFSTAVHNPWKTLRVSHIPTAPTTGFSLSIQMQKGPGLSTSVQAHSSMRICWCQYWRHDVTNVVGHGKGRGKLLE